MIFALGDMSVTYCLRQDSPYRLSASRPPHQLNQQPSSLLPLPPQSSPINASYLIQILRQSDEVPFILSIKFDVARFGSMVYEIVTGRRYEFYVNAEIEVDSDDGASYTYREWPTSEQFPDTTDVFLGDLIRMCWLKDGFGTMEEVHRALQAVITPPKGVFTTPDWRSLLHMATQAIASMIFAIVVARRLP